MAVNQYFKETLNKLSTTIDTTTPAGLEMSAAFDKYAEKVIKPLYPKGTKLRQTDTVDDAAGRRNVDWYFKSGNAETTQAVHAAVNNFVTSWGQARGLLDDAGNPAAGADPVPMQVADVVPQDFKGTVTRILNPRTGKSVGAQAVRSGGEYAFDKKSGKSTWSVPDNAVTETGKNLARSLRAQVREGDKAWMEGRAGLASLADGASPATTSERAIARRNYNYRAQAARYKNISPQQEADEYKFKMEQRARRLQYEADYAVNNPSDPTVLAKQQKIDERNKRILQQTPGTKEFKKRIGQRLDSRVASGKEELAWARRNKREPLAKEIIKRNRMKTFTGRALERTKSFVKTAAAGAVIGGIFAAVSAAVKFLSSLPDILTNVRTIAVKGATLGVTNAQLVRFAALEKRLPGLKED
ncbi:MAG: hypothetical protein LBD44_01035, partial [Spirochaetaceae bacterium]|nr:hypothetical protein [Spirochaetaceae bacterium]